jgi:hypothetical protein
MQNYLSLKKDSKLSEYILFLNSLDLQVNIVNIIEIQDLTEEDCALGWVGVKTLICINDRQDIYEIDIRFAWGNHIFQQHLYDFCWNQSILLCSNNKHKSRRKLIIYLCAPSTTLVDRIQMRSVPKEFIIGSYWKSIDHLYLLLPCPHPFELTEVLNTDINKHSYTTDILPLSTNIINKKSGVEGGLRTKGINKSSTLAQPLISVITVVFNGEKNLEQTIQSVINQNHNNFEYIIIDGGSTDKTIEIIQKYEDRIDYWKSEKDMGIYDGMNKGIDLADGQWLNFMNCGDCFYNHHSLSSVPLNSDVDFYYSDTILYNSNGIAELRVCSQEKKDVIHQSIVYNKNLHSTYKYLVHERLTISDYFFFRRNDNKNWVKLDLPLAIYNTEGISGTNSKGFIQKLFVNYMSGDISEFEMALAIIAKIARAPIRMMRRLLVEKSLLKSVRRF